MADRVPSKHSWLKRWTICWLGQSKPTEWILAFTGMAGVIATVFGAYYLIHNGYLDQKKSELEARRSEIAIQNTKLEMDQMALIAKRDSLGGQIVDYSKQLQDKEKDLQNVSGHLALAEQKVKEVEAKFDMYVRHEKALGTFEEVSAATRALPKSKPGIFCSTSAITHDSFSVSIRCSAEVPTNSVSAKTCKERELVVAQLPWIRNLKSLSITGVKLDTTDMDIISKLPNLTCLSLTNCGLDDTCISHLILMPSVKMLDLSCNPATHTPGHGAKCALRQLCIHNTAFSDKSLAGLLRECPDIVEIDAQDSPLGDYALAAINSDSVKALYLVNSSVTIVGCKALIERMDPQEIYLANSFVGTSADDLRQFLKSKSLKCMILLEDKPVNDTYRLLRLPREPGSLISGEK